METDDKEVKVFEKEYKAQLDEKVSKYIFKENSIVDQIQIDKRKFGFYDQIPDISITFNNKISEINKRFNDVQLSMYSQIVKNYGPMNQNYVSSSFIGEAVINDLILNLEEANKVLEQYSESLKEINEKKGKSTEIANVSKFRNIFLRIRGFFRFNGDNVRYSKEEKIKLKSYVVDYKQIDEKLCNYNLKEQIVSSLINQISEQGYSKREIPILLEECIIPEMQKLGFNDLILKLKQDINKKFEEKENINEIENEKLKSWEFSKKDKEKIQEESKKIALNFNNIVDSEIKKNVEEKVID